MMNFYYDPILGLKYNCLELVFNIDISCLPQEVDLEKILYLFKQQGVQFLAKREQSYITQVNNITEYML